VNIPNLPASFSEPPYPEQKSFFQQHAEYEIVFLPFLFLFTLLPTMCYNVNKFNARLPILFRHLSKMQKFLVTRDSKQLNAIDGCLGRVANPRPVATINVAFH